MHSLGTDHAQTMPSAYWYLPAESSNNQLKHGLCFKAKLGMHQRNFLLLSLTERTLDSLNPHSLSLLLKFRCKTVDGLVPCSYPEGRVTCI